MQPLTTEARIERLRDSLRIVQRNTRVNLDWINDAINDAGALLDDCRERAKAEAATPGRVSAELRAGLAMSGVSPEMLSEVEWWNNLTPEQRAREMDEEVRIAARLPAYGADDEPVCLAEDVLNAG